MQQFHQPIMFGCGSNDGVKRGETTMKSLVEILTKEVQSAYDVRNHVANIITKFAADHLDATKREADAFTDHVYGKKEWVSVDVLKQWLELCLINFPIPSNDIYYAQAYTDTPIFDPELWEADFKRWKKEVLGLEASAK
jgi:hypothetical protein